MDYCQKIYSTHFLHTILKMVNLVYITFKMANALVTCEIKLFQNYFTLRRHPTEIILFQRGENLPKIISEAYCSS